jgi:hypothetical protein
MNCSQCREYLDDYVRGLLSSENHDVVSQHLKSCDECFNESESSAALLAVLAKEPVLVVDPRELADFMPGIWSKIEPVRKPYRYWIGRLVPIFATAAVLSVLVFKPSRNYLTVANQSTEYGQVGAATDSAQYNQSTYEGLLRNLLIDKNSQELDIYENELDDNSGILVNGSFETELYYLSDEGLQAIDKKLSELRGNEG